MFSSAANKWSVPYVRKRHLILRIVSYIINFFFLSLSGYNLLPLIHFYRISVCCILFSVRKSMSTLIFYRFFFSMRKSMRGDIITFRWIFVRNISPPCEQMCKKRYTNSNHWNFPCCILPHAWKTIMKGNITAFPLYT